MRYTLLFFVSVNLSTFHASLQQKLFQITKTHRLEFLKKMLFEATLFLMESDNRKEVEVKLLESFHICTDFLPLPTPLLMKVLSFHSAQKRIIWRPVRLYQISVGTHYWHVHYTRKWKQESVKGNKHWGASFHLGFQVLP